MDLKLFFLFFLKIIDRFFWVLNFLCLCSSLFFLKIKLGLGLVNGPGRADPAHFYLAHGSNGLGLTGR